MNDTNPLVATACRCQKRKGPAFSQLLSRMLGHPPGIGTGGPPRLRSADHHLAPRSVQSRTPETSNQRPSCDLISRHLPAGSATMSTSVFVRARYQSAAVTSRSIRETTVV